MQREMGSISIKLMKRCLEWLCHLAIISDQRAPKKEGALSLAGEDTPKMWTKKKIKRHTKRKEGPACS